jgi:hypothetical protein
MFVAKDTNLFRFIGIYETFKLFPKVFLFDSSKSTSGLLSLTGNKIEHNLSCSIRIKIITRSK